MSPSSTGESPPTILNGHSAPAVSNGRGFPLPSRDTFNIDIPTSQLNTSNPPSALKSPATVKSQRTPSFSRDSILGSALKAGASQRADFSGDGRLGDPNGLQKVSSDEGSNPLKRRNTDAGVDYPRRRATIAVRCALPSRGHFFFLLPSEYRHKYGRLRLTRTPCICSVKYVAPANLGAMAPNRNASSAWSSVPTAFTVSLGLSLTQVTN